MVSCYLVSQNVLSSCDLSLPQTLCQPLLQSPASFQWSCTIIFNTSALTVIKFTYNGYDCGCKLSIFFPTNDEHQGWALTDEPGDSSLAVRTLLCDAIRSSTFSLSTLLNPNSLIRPTILLLGFNHFFENLEVNHKTLGPVFSRLHKDDKWPSYTVRAQVPSVSPLLSAACIFYSPGYVMVQRGCWCLAIIFANQVAGRKKSEKARGRRVFRTIRS